ncbi:hypothetical protein Bbelb_065210 [Branchiostoma belcheri]|nr:hypothetical protein Bbelb_065210 [Branchiostoma belcheri]
MAATRLMNRRGSGTSSGRVRYVMRESAVRSAGECRTSCGRVRYVLRQSAGRRRISQNCPLVIGVATTKLLLLQVTKYASSFAGRTRAAIFRETSNNISQDVPQYPAVEHSSLKRPHKLECSTAGYCGTSCEILLDVSRNIAALVRPAKLDADVLRESAGRCAGLPSGECGTSSGRVRYVLRESAVRPAGECGTFCGSQTFCSSLLEQRKLEVNDLRPACKQDWTGSGCNIKGAGGFC